MNYIEIKDCLLRCALNHSEYTEYCDRPGFDRVFETHLNSEALRYSTSSLLTPDREDFLRIGNPDLAINMLILTRMHFRPIDLAVREENVSKVEKFVKKHEADYHLTQGAIGIGGVWSKTLSLADTDLAAMIILRFQTAIDLPNSFQYPKARGVAYNEWKEYHLPHVISVFRPVWEVSFTELAALFDGKVTLQTKHDRKTVYVRANFPVREASALFAFQMKL